MDLAGGGKWRIGGVMAALAVLGGRGSGSADEDGCGVIMDVACETGVGPVAGLAVAATGKGDDGGDIAPGSVIARQGVIEVGIFVAGITDGIMN